MSTPMVTTIGFGSVSLPASAGVFQQMPNIQCDVVRFGMSSGNIRLAASSSPGSNYIVLNVATSGSANTSTEEILTGGNASNLYIANDGSTAQVVGFKWTLRSAFYIVPAI